MNPPCLPAVCLVGSLMKDQISAHAWFKKLDKENSLWRIYLSIRWFAGLHPNNRITGFNPKRLNQVNLAWVSLEFANTSSRRMTVCYRLWYWRHISGTTSLGGAFPWLFTDVPLWATLTGKMWHLHRLCNRWDSSLRFISDFTLRWCWF